MTVAVCDYVLTSIPAAVNAPGFPEALAYGIGMLAV